RRGGFPAAVPRAARARGTAARCAGPARATSPLSPAPRCGQGPRRPLSRREPWGARPALPAREVRSCGVRGGQELAGVDERGDGLDVAMDLPVLLHRGDDLTDGGVCRGDASPGAEWLAEVERLRPAPPPPAPTGGGGARHPRR